MLPPDNYQEDPTPVVAHRTSPTNLGLYLLSLVSAKDFGWIGLSEAVDRLEVTLASMEGLARVHGHFYNWYDTHDLRPLSPPYISSVDSGNLAGHLIAVANACGEWRGRSTIGAGSFAGIGDALELAQYEAQQLRKAQPDIAAWTGFDDACTRFAEDCSGLRPGMKTSPNGWPRSLSTLMHWPAQLDSLTEREGIDGSDLVFWTGAVRASIE